jgi:N-acetylglucosamine-6-sulfatase
VTSTQPSPKNHPLINKLVAAGTALILVAVGTVFFIASVRSAPAQADSAIDPAPIADPLIEGQVGTEEAPVNTAGDLAAVKNIVFVLADDLDWNLFNQIPRLAALKDQGITFTNQTVTDSLCCPSRVSIMRGQYIHNHKVISNIEETGGGWPTFRDRKQEQDCLPVWLDNVGVTTAMFGKYLNDFPSKPSEATYIPPGWDEWGVPISRGDAYSGYNYTMNDNGTLVRYGNKPTDFLNDVITNKATGFIETAQSPFFLQLSTYSPHKPAPVATRNVLKHGGTLAPRNATYNAFGVDEPKWMKDIKKLTPKQLAKADTMWRKRARSAESVGDSVDAIMAKLKETGHDKDTLVVVTTDNGYHVAERRMFKGKRTPYASDTVVPMIVLGPGVPTGVTVDTMTSTIDLGPTFAQLLGATAPNWVDGRSLVGFFNNGETPQGWRNAVLSESLGISTPADPDYQKNAPPRFFALRSEKWLYVEYADGSKTLYDREKDPFEMVNLVKTANPLLLRSLSTQLKQLSTCSGDTCRTADSVTLPLTAISNEKSLT